MLGFDPDQPPGYDTLVMRLHSEDIETFTKRHREALTAGAGFTTTVRVLGSDDELRVNFDVDTATDEAGNCTHYFGTVRRA